MDNQTFVILLVGTLGLSFLAFSYQPKYYLIHSPAPHTQDFQDYDTLHEYIASREQAMRECIRKEKKYFEDRDVHFIFTH